MTEREKTFQETYETEIVAAWREQLAEAAENPWLADLLLRYGDRILARFIAFYQRLRRLPHKTMWRMRLKLGLGVGGAALLLALSGMGLGVAQAETFDDVDTVADLKAAIHSANGNSEADTIILAPDTTFALDAFDNHVYARSGLPVISSTITIEGNRSTIRRLPNPQDKFRILAVGTKGKLTLNEATISGGAQGEDGMCGGGIWNTGALTITDSTIEGNEAYYGAGVCNAAPGNLAQLLISRCVISGNTAISDTNGMLRRSPILGGAGVLNGAAGRGEARARITNQSVVTGNVSMNTGGGVLSLVYGGTANLEIEDSIISGNAAAHSGGGVANTSYISGTAGLTINESRVTGNLVYYGLADGNDRDSVNGDAYAHVAGGGVANWAIGDVPFRDVPGRVELPVIGSEDAEKLHEQLGHWAEGLGNRLNLDDGALLDRLSSEKDLLDGEFWKRVRLPRQRGLPEQSTPKIGDQGDAEQLLQSEGGSSHATAHIESSTISGNFAVGVAGGIANLADGASAAVTINRTTISENGSHLGGGVGNSGLFSGTAGLTIRDSTVSGNTCFRDDGGGGGIYNSGVGHASEESCYGGLATATISNSTVSGNAAFGFGGGLANGPIPYSWSERRLRGGCGTSRLVSQHSTISGNLGELGGGLFNIAFPLDDVVSEVTLGHTIVSGNRSYEAGRELVNAYGTVVADDYNLFGERGEDRFTAFRNTFTVTGESDVNATSEGLDVPYEDILDPTLRDNGGRTKTHALVFGSPAVDAGDSGFAPPPFYDQRGAGYPRVVNERIDIGAFEYQPPVGGVTVQPTWMRLLLSRAKFLLLGLAGTVGAFVEVLRSRRG